MSVQGCIGLYSGGTKFQVAAVVGLSLPDVNLSLSNHKSSVPPARPPIQQFPRLSPSSVRIMAVASRRLAKELQDIMKNGMPTGQGY